MRDARMARQATSVWALVLAPPIIAGLLVLGSFNADSRAAPLGPQLAVTQLRVAPTILRSGGKVRVTALITNRGDEPARNLQLGVAVARGTAAPVTRDGARVRWAPVEMTPSAPIAILAPSEKLEFTATVSLEGDGVVSVGVFARAGETLLPPQARKVRVIEPARSLVQIGLLFVVFFVALSAVVESSLQIFRREPAAALLVPDRRVLLVGACLMIGGPTLLWSRENWFRWWLALGGVALFAAGWILVGAGLRPRRRVRRGALGAAWLYLLVGLGWTIVLNVGLDARPVEDLLQRGSITGALTWPFQVGQVIGLLRV